MDRSFNFLTAEKGNASQSVRSNLASQMSHAVTILQPKDYKYVLLRVSVYLSAVGWEGDAKVALFSSAGPEYPDMWIWIC